MAYTLRPLPPVNTADERTSNMKGSSLAQIKANFEKLEKTYEVNSTKDEPLAEGWRHMQEARGWK